MAKKDWRETRDIEEAAAETREPSEARRIRAEDHAETREWLDEAEQDVRAADRALDENQTRLRDLGDGIRENRETLARTGDLTRDVAERASSLRADTSDVAETTRRIEIEDGEGEK
ncbi:MAG TPA: hypothetical protein VEA99_20275 [Gemmatimonadaceae bacterium]|nr:hypothetical protein [Gemmatimonadaceae bacterium]